MIEAKKIPQHYKRTLTDAKKKCPYCKAQWVWTLDRRVEYIKQRKVTVECRKCNRIFIWSGGVI